MCTICFSAESAPEFPRKREIDELCSPGVVGSAPEREGEGRGEESSSISHMLRHPSARQCYFEMKPIYAP